MTPKWIGVGYAKPMAWQLKKDMPDDIRAEAKRVDFGVHGLGYVALDYAACVLMPGGGRMPTWIFCLTTPGWVIGPRDAQAAWTMPWAEEWRAACAARRLEQ